MKYFREETLAVDLQEQKRRSDWVPPCQDLIQGFRFRYFFQWKPIFQIALVSILMGEAYFQELDPQKSNMGRCGI